LDEASLVKRARQLQSASNPAAEKAAWNALLKSQPQSSYRFEAYLRLGILAYQRSEWETAVNHLNKALGSSLPQAKRDEGFYYYGLSQYKRENYAQAIRAIESIYPRLSKERKKKALEVLLTSARKAGKRRILIAWKVKRLPFLPPSERQQLRRSLLKEINGAIPLADLQTLFAKGEAPYKFPYDAIGIRLAKSYFHRSLFSQSAMVVSKLQSGLAADSPWRRQLPRLQQQLRTHNNKPAARTLGVILPLSGKGAFVGRLMKDTIRMATRGIPRLRLIFKDSQTRSRSAAKAVSELVKKHRVLAIFGPVFSQPAKAAAYRAQQLRVPLFSISRVEGLADIGPYVFRNNLTLSRMGRAMARYSFKTLGLQRYAVFYPKSQYGRIQTMAFWKEIERLGGKVVGSESFPPGLTNYTKPAKRLVGRYELRYRPLWYSLTKNLYKIKSRLQRKRLYKKIKQQFPPITHFDAIFIPARWRRVYKIVPSLAQQDVEVKLHWRFWEKQRIKLYYSRNQPVKFVQLLGTNGWNNESLFNFEKRHIVGSIFCARFFARDKSAVTRNFISAFKRDYPRYTSRGQKPPPALTAYAYDTMKILVKLAMNPDTSSSRDAFRRGLLKIQNFMGVTGRISIQSNGEALAPIKYLLAHRYQEFRLKGVAKTLIP
jgi:ABC-type branched-subunit amino acid transport system substrate-binding protein